jgi:drug/metabolite transporter (DMT)-like permease
VFTGELIAIATVLCWTISVQFFSSASKMAGAIPVNIIRVGIALLLFSIFLFFRDGSIVPTNFPFHDWLLLSLSGIVGFFIGDISFLRSLLSSDRALQCWFTASLPLPLQSLAGCFLKSIMHYINGWAFLSRSLESAWSSLRKNQRFLQYEN